MDTSLETALFDATLRPNPPMSKTALRAIVGLVAAINFGFGVLFVIRGAWPVTPFMGADVLLLAWALNLTHTAAQAFEHVRLTPALLSVLKHPARGRESEISLNPYWVRVEPQSRSGLLLWSHGRAVQIGKFLTPSECLSFANGLKAALYRAREIRTD